MEINLELPSQGQGLHESSTINNVPCSTSIDVQNTGLDLSTGENEAVSCKGVDHCGEQFNETDVNEGGTCGPKNGLAFESKEAAYYFYREYARTVGFGITIKASRRSKKTGKFIDVKIACSRFGSMRDSNTTVNPRSCPKSGCKAGMHMKRREDDKWVIYNFVEEHNHEICPDDIFMGMRGKNKQTDSLKCQKKGLQLVLDEEDVQKLLEYFMNMQEENSGFFYAFDLDPEQRVRNVLWVDAKARSNYAAFSDVVLFDMFYVRNKFRIPFAPFVGVNHHCQHLLLGCALIGEDSAASFSWLMRTWLKAVGGQAPKVIITDNDGFVSEGVVEAFPEARHCICLWHILSKLPERLGCVMDQYENFIKRFRKCIYHSWTDDQFERRWSKIVGKFELGENEWFHSLFKDRKKWVPHYWQGTSLSGMSAAERSKSISSYFDKYIDREATFEDFIKRYRLYLQDLYDKEVKAEHEAKCKQPALRSLSPFENQVCAVYTHAAFKKFQSEVLGVVSCQLRKESEEGTRMLFRVEDFEERESFFVALIESKLEICCSCYSFEYQGFLCKHSHLVLQHQGVSEIPQQYILKRWSRNATNRVNRIEQFGRRHYRLERFNDLCRRASKLGELGSVSEEVQSMAFKLLEDTLKTCVGMNNTHKNLSDPSGLSALTIGFSCEDHRGNTSKSSKKKKMSKKRKVYSERQGVGYRSQDSYQIMEQVSSRAHKLDNCYIPQHDMEETELSSRTARLDGYYGSQQTIQGSGQLTSISPICAGYYSNHSAMPATENLQVAGERLSHYTSHQCMQGMVAGQVDFRATVCRPSFDIEETLQDMAMDSSQFQNSTSRDMSDQHLSR